MGRSLFRSRGASFMNAWNCAAVMSVAAIGDCAFTEDAMSITNITITILRMRWLLSLAVVVNRKSECCRRIAHSGALQPARRSDDLRHAFVTSFGVYCASRTQIVSLERPWDFQVPANSLIHNDMLLVPKIIPLLPGLVIEVQV